MQLLISFRKIEYTNHTEILFLLLVVYFEVSFLFAFTGDASMCIFVCVCVSECIITLLDVRQQEGICYNM